MTKRRANHEGSIYKRQDGRWVASVTLPSGTRKSYYGTTRAAVAQKLTVGLKAVQDGVPVPSDQLRADAISTNGSRARRARCVKAPGAAMNSSSGSMRSRHWGRSP